MKISTADYRSNHGAEPRGRGSWGFVFARSPEDLNRKLNGPDYLDHIWWAPGSLTFGDAKKLAIVEAKARDASWIGVCS